MQKFKSHKIVEAVKIQSITPILTTGGVLLHVADGLDNIEVNRAYLLKHEPRPGGYYVKYPDGYESFSPAEAFEDGYTAVDAYPTPVETLTTGQPKITGYRNLSQDEIDMMNCIKALGGSIEGHISMVGSHLRTQSMDARTSDEEARIKEAEPARWLAMARTDFQIALMKLTRAVAQPTSF